MRLKSYAKNPLTEWGKWMFTKIIWEVRNIENRLDVGYMVEIRKSSFGYRNSLHDFSKITNSSLGDFSYLAAQSWVSNSRIGKFCSVGHEVRCGLGRHPSKGFVSTHPAFFLKGKGQAQESFVDADLFDEVLPIRVGNDVWIGRGAIIRDGVALSDGVIVAAGAIVTEDIPPYAVVGGVPARIIRLRFSERNIEELLRIKWWDKDLNWIRRNASLFSDCDRFVGELSDR